MLGYELMGEKRLDLGVEVFRLHVEAYPYSSNAYDSLAEAYKNRGERELAIKNYEKSLELNPGEQQRDPDARTAQGSVTPPAATRTPEGRRKSPHPALSRKRERETRSSHLPSPGGRGCLSRSGRPQQKTQANVAPARRANMRARRARPAQTRDEHAERVPRISLRLRSPSCLWRARKGRSNPRVQNVT